MAIVAVYQYRARFRSHSDPLDAPPAVGLSRNGLLFLKQAADVRSDADAVAACLRHDAFDAVIESYGVLDLAKLQLPRNQPLVSSYEKARRDGSALIYNIDSAPASEAPAVTQWGFRPK